MLCEDYNIRRINMSRNVVMAVGCSFMAGFLLAQEQPKTRVEHPRENTEWIVSYAYNANDAKLPRVLLVGDSICNGYSGDVC